MKNLIKKNISFAVMLMSLIAVRWSFADQYRVPTGSMEPTIHVGDTVFVNKSAYDLKIPYTNLVLTKIGEPQRGDIVVFIFPVDESTNLIKRLIGLPGDHVQVRDGFIFINGQPVAGSEQGQQALHNSTQNEVEYNEILSGRKITVKRTQAYLRHEDFDVVVPEGQYFFMGDNRDNSNDSRYWGLVPRANLKGRALRVLWNLSFSDNWVPNTELGRFGHKLD